MANKYDLNTFYQSHTSATSLSTNIGGNIAAGKTRFLTYLRIERNVPASYDHDISGVSVVIGNSHDSGIEYSGISANAKYSLRLQEVELSANVVKKLSDKSIVNQFPDTPDMDHPICAIAGGTSSYMLLGVGDSGPAVRIFGQYYDE